MLKTNLAAGALALLFFLFAQHQGWNLFDREAGAQTARVNSAGGSGGRNYHK